MELPKAVHHAFTSGFVHVTRDDHDVTSSIVGDDWFEGRWTLGEGPFPTPKLTASSHLKMDGWNTIVSFWVPAYFQGPM